MAQILRVSITGAMPSSEVWSVNPVFAVGGDFGTPVSATQAQTIATAIAAIAVPTGLLQFMTSSTTVTGCRVEARSLAGVLEVQAEGVKATPTPGSGASAHPFQTSIVFSLRTATPGPRGRGRLYWPATGVTMTASSLRLGSGFPTSGLSGFKTYLSGIESAIEATLPGVSFAVWSRTSSSTANVTSVQVGDVLDTQRRRRDATIEAITSTPWP